MTLTLEVPKIEIDQSPKKKTENLFFRVFLGFRKPSGYVSLFYEGYMGGCGVYNQLGLIFSRRPSEIYESMSKLTEGESEVFMQEYLSLEEASEVTAKASLFANIAMCTCFLEQEAFFKIKEVKK